MLTFLKDIGLCDALIFDNGNDIFAHYLGQTTYANSENNRHTRLTAALHYKKEKSLDRVGDYLISGIR